MSNAVKIFILVNLVATLVLAAMSMRDYATRENWKRRWDQDTRELKKEVDLSNQALANSSKDKVRAENAFLDRERMITDLQAASLKMQDQLTTSEQEKQNFFQSMSSACHSKTLAFLPRMCHRMSLHTRIETALTLVLQRPLRPAKPESISTEHRCCSSLRCSSLRSMRLG